MPRGDYRRHEPKKPKVEKRKLLSPAPVVPTSPEPEVIPKKKAGKEQALSSRGGVE